MSANLGTTDVAVALGHSQPERLEALYNSYFTPNQSAVRAASATGHFQIYSAIDYSVPISYSDSSQKVHIR